MADQWTIPQTDPRGHHVVRNYACHIFKYSPRCLTFQIPPDAEHPGPAFQPNMPTYQEGKYPTVQNCNCAQCFAMRPTQIGPTTWYPVEQQDRRHFGVSFLITMPPHSRSLTLSPKSIGSPHLNHGQNVANRAETALIVPNRTPAQLVPPQTAVSAKVPSRIHMSDVLKQGIPDFGYASVYDRAGPSNVELL